MDTDDSVVAAEADDGRKSIKVWSNRMQAYYYKSKDPN